jgi:hypothetical protein
MNLIFIRDKECNYADKAEPFILEFAKNENLILNKYFRVIDNIPLELDLNVSPVLFFIENQKILGKIIGFFGNEKHYDFLKKELEYIKDPSKRTIGENNEK